MLLSIWLLYCLRSFKKLEGARIFSDFRTSFNRYHSKAGRITEPAKQSLSSFA
jgi:hypothetical protein